MKKTITFILFLSVLSCSQKETTCEICGDHDCEKTHIKCLICGKYDCEDCVCAQKWDYLVYTDYDAWCRITVDERRSSCNIPENIIHCMTNDKLLDLFFRNPYFIGLFSSNYDSGFEYQYKSYNALRALFQREDAGIYLIKRYMEHFQLFFTNLEDAKRYSKAEAYEILLTRVEMNGYEREEGLKIILRALVAGYEERLKYPETWGSTFYTNSFARAKIIAKIDPSFVELLWLEERNPVFIGGHTVYDTLQILNEMSYKLIK